MNDDNSLNDLMVDQDALSEHVFNELPMHNCCWDIARGIDGKIYVAVCTEGPSCEVAHMYQYNPAEKKMHHLFDLGDITGERPENGHTPHSKIHYTMCCASDGKIYCATHTVANPKGHPQWSFDSTTSDVEACYTGGHIIVYDPVKDSARTLGRFAERSSIPRMWIDTKHNRIFGTMTPRGHQFVFHIDEKRFVDIGNIGWAAWFFDEEGGAYTTDVNGFFHRWDPKTERITVLNVRTPDRVILRETFYDREGGIYALEDYGFSRIVRLHPKITDVEIDDLGFPNMENKLSNNLGRTRAATFGHDGRIYLISCGHILSIDPRTGKRDDLGNVACNDHRNTGISRSVTGDDGLIYFAEVNSHPTRIYIYKPPYIHQPWLRSKKVPYHGSAAYMAVQKDAKMNVKTVEQLTEERESSYFIADEEACRWKLRGFLLGRNYPDDMIPFEECEVTSLTVAPDGMVYGGTSGRQAHVFAFDGEKVTPVCTVDGAERIWNALVVTSGGALIAGTFKESNSSYTGGQILRIDPANGLVKKIGIPVPREGIRSMIVDAENEIIYGLTWPEKKFFSFDLDSNRATIFGSVRDRSEVIYSNEGFHAERPAPSVLVRDRKGYIYCSGQMGKIYCFVPETQKLKLLENVRTPSAVGRQYLNGWETAVLGPDNAIYGGTSNGYLFRFDTEKSVMENLGRPSLPLRSTALVSVGNILFGAVSDTYTPSRFFLYDIEHRNFQELGILRVYADGHWVGPGRQDPDASGFVNIGAMISTPDGRVIFGERERLSLLVSLRPPF